MAEQIDIRVLTVADVCFGMHLRELAGWNQLEADWRRFLAMQPEGCFVAEVDDAPAGTATTTQYGDRFGWVGMVLVLPEKRRRGLGTVLLRHCIEYLEGRGVACVKLDATPLGKKLYDTLGFVDEYYIERKQVDAAPAVTADSAGISAMQIEDIDLLSRYDAPSFGAPRTQHLSLLLEQMPDGCFVHRDGNGLVDGYLFTRPGANAYQIGPWAADDDAIGEALLTTALSRLTGSPVFLDVPMTHSGPTEIVTRFGFETQRPLIRMYRGDNAHPGAVSGVYAFCGPETG